MNSRPLTVHDMKVGTKVICVYDLLPSLKGLVGYIAEVY
jgi:hypothetical protein